MTRSNKSDSVNNVLVHDYDGLNLERFMGDSCPGYSGNQECGREPSASTYWAQLTRLFPKLDVHRPGPGDFHFFPRCALLTGKSRVVQANPREP
jgi:hypothetical protein